VTIELQALIRRAVPLSEVFAYAGTLISKRATLTLEGTLRPEAVIIGPYEIPPSHDGIRRAHSSWELDYLCVSAGPIATVGLALGHVVSDEEMGFFTPGQTDQQRLERAEFEGYRATIDAGFLRTRASFGLASVLACSIATLCRARIIDDEGRLKQGVELIDPAVVAAMLAKHSTATCFEELADMFCAEINFSPDWPDWRAQLAAAKRMSPSN
jgi:hypothetical protein